MDQLTEKQRNEYNILRKNFDRSKTVDISSACNAPYNNMYFTVEGNVAPCWLTVGHLDQWSPNNSIRDIWFGEKFQEYRQNLKSSVFTGKCSICKSKIDSGAWPLAIAYDGFPVNAFPSMMELELSNQCNLECVMCDGRLSSGIRKNRENLPPLPQIYDDTFVEQLKEFIPHLTELRFNGGEPFAQKIVLDICNLVADINPGLKINIATNGTVYNKNVRRIMDNCNLHLNISIDSLKPKRYEEIRVNSNWNLLMHNFEIFRDYCFSYNRSLSVMVNPMRTNWEEMPDFLTFCNTNQVFLWYNTIHHPNHLSLWNLPAKDLENIYNTLVTKVIELQPGMVYPAYSNWEKFDHFVTKQIYSWWQKQISREINHTSIEV